MIKRKAFKFKLAPALRERCLLAQTAGCVRLVWNKTLAEALARLEQKVSVGRYASFTKELTAWKQQEGLSFLKVVHSQPLQQTLKDLDRALQDGFAKTKGFPKFKKKRAVQSFRYPQGVKVAGNKLFLPKIGWVKFFKSQEIQGVIKNTTLSLECGSWYASLQTEWEVEEPCLSLKPEIALDLGIANLVSTSEGEFIAGLNPYRQQAKQLAHAQRCLARRVKGSKNREKMRRKVQRLHERIRRCRSDQLHKISDHLTKNHSVIYIEDLKIVHMSRSAKGSVAEPGCNVAAKAGLNKAILDQGWYELRRQLQYKAAWRGGSVVAVNPRYTSQKCSSCGYKAAANRQSQSHFFCGKCGAVANADTNAAKNILTAGQAGLACESNHLSVRKQELLVLGNQEPIWASA